MRPEAVPTVASPATDSASRRLTFASPWGVVTVCWDRHWTERERERWQTEWLRRVILPQALADLREEDGR